MSHIDSETPFSFDAKYTMKRIEVRGSVDGSRKTVVNIVSVCLGEETRIAEIPAKMLEKYDYSTVFPQLQLGSAEKREIADHLRNQMRECESKEIITIDHPGIFRYGKDYFQCLGNRIIFLPDEHDRTQTDESKKNASQPVRSLEIQELSSHYYNYIIPDCFNKMVSTDEVNRVEYEINLFFNSVDAAKLLRMAMLVQPGTTDVIMAFLAMAPLSPFLKDALSVDGFSFPMLYLTAPTGYQKTSFISTVLPTYSVPNDLPSPVLGADATTTAMRCSMDYYHGCVVYFDDINRGSETLKKNGMETLMECLRESSNNRGHKSKNTSYEINAMLIASGEMRLSGATNLARVVQIEPEKPLGGEKLKELQAESHAAFNTAWALWTKCAYENKGLILADLRNNIQKYRKKDWFNNRLADSAALIRTGYECLKEWIRQLRPEKNAIDNLNEDKFKKRLKRLLRKQEWIMKWEAEKDAASIRRKAFNQCPAREIFRLFFLPVNSGKKLMIDPDGLLKNNSKLFKYKEDKGYVTVDRDYFRQFLTKYLEADISHQVEKYLKEIDALYFKDGAENGHSDNIKLRIKVLSLEEEMNTLRHSGLDLKRLPFERCWWIYSKETANEEPDEDEI